MTCNYKDIICLVWDRLEQDQVLNDLVGGRLYNHVPQDDTLYPFVAFGGSQTSPTDTFDDSGEAILYDLHVFDTNTDFEDFYDIRDRIKALLHKQQEEMTSATCCITSIMLVSSGELTERDMERQGREFLLTFEIKYY